MRVTRSKLVGMMMVLALMMAACGTDDAPAPAPETPETEVPDAEDDAEEPAAADLPEVCDGQDGTGLTVGYGDLSAGIPFVTQVWNNIQEVADACNLEIVYADNDLDPERALENARTFAAQGVDGVLWFQIDEGIEGAACDELRANDPDLPVIAIDIAHPSCAVFFGANNPLAGELAGEALGEWAQENWDCEIDSIVTLETFAVGEVNAQRVNGMIRGIQNVCGDLEFGDFETWTPTIADSIVNRVDGGGTTDGAFPLVRDTFTPLQGQRIAVVALNDDMGLAALAAAEELGIADDVVFASQGADATIHSEIRANPNYVGSTGYFPERYGEWLIPAIIKMIRGEDVPDPIYVEHEFIGENNIDEYY